MKNKILYIINFKLEEKIERGKKSIIYKILNKKK
jgi:hypothetical protein